MAQGAWDSGTWDDALWDSLPITGNTGTGSAGNLGIAVDQTLTGASATGAAGTPSPGITIAITGVQATGAVGNESETITLALSGAQATGAAGSVSLAAGVAITGVEATGSPGTVIAYIPPIFIDDTHDGDYKKKRWAEERAKKEKRKQEIINIYEQIVEGKPEVAEEIVAPYIKTKARGQQTAATVQQIDFDKLMRDIAKVEALYIEHIEMDDEEVLALL